MGKQWILHLFLLGPEKRVRALASHDLHRAAPPPPLPPAAAAYVFASHIPGARLVIFDDLGHIPHEEDPARTVAPVIEFLSGRYMADGRGGGNAH